MFPPILYPTIVRFPLERANGIQVVNTCHALASRGCSVYLFVLKNSAESVPEALNFYGLKPIKNLHIIRLPFVRGKGSFLWNATAYASCILFMYYYLSKLRHPVILTRDFFLARIFLPWCRRGKGKLFYECHHIEYVFRQELPRLYLGVRVPDENKINKIRKAEHTLYNTVSGIITITQSLEKRIRDEFKTCVPITVIRDGIQDIQNETSLGESSLFKNNQSLTRLLYVGDLNPVKGVDSLLRVVKNINGVQFMIAGGVSSDKTQKVLKEISQSMGIEDKVQFLGYFPPYQVPQLYKRAHILLLPLTRTIQNSYYTSPLKLFEYMASGKPMIAADLPSTREILTHEETALLVSPEDDKGWENAIKRLIKDKNLAKKISLNAQALAKEFTWEKRAGRIEEFVLRQKL